MNVKGSVDAKPKDKSRVIRKKTAITSVICRVNLGAKHYSLRYLIFLP